MLALHKIQGLFPVSQSKWTGKICFLAFSAVVQFLYHFGLKNWKKICPKPSYQDRIYLKYQIYRPRSPLNIFCFITLPKLLISVVARWGCSTGTLSVVPLLTPSLQDFNIGWFFSPMVWTKRPCHSRLWMNFLKGPALPDLCGSQAAVLGAYKRV